MPIDIAIEIESAERSLAWFLDYPGCFAYAASPDALLAAAPGALLDYAAWIRSRNHGRSWVQTEDIQLRLAETWRVYCINEQYDLVDEGYEVNAWFRHDWKSLTETDLERGLQLLGWSRADLLDAVQGLDEQTLNAQYPGERWSIAGILGHVGNAEWWYMDRLGLAIPRQDMPEEPFEKLARVRQYFLEILPGLVGSTRVVGEYGEFWSPRKMLRRALWHERDHTQHIHKLLSAT
jgi:uncharacterized damage-inducible protein DinB